MKLSSKTRFNQMQNGFGFRILLCVLTVETKFRFVSELHWTLKKSFIRTSRFVIAVWVILWLIFELLNSYKQLLWGFLFQNGRVISSWFPAFMTASGFLLRYRLQEVLRPGAGPLRAITAERKYWWLELDWFSSAAEEVSTMTIPLGILLSGTLHNV